MPDRAPSLSFLTRFVLDGVGVVTCVAVAIRQGWAGRGGGHCRVSSRSYVLCLVVVSSVLASSARSTVTMPSSASGGLGGGHVRVVGRVCGCDVVPTVCRVLGLLSLLLVLCPLRHRVQQSSGQRL